MNLERLDKYYRSSEAEDDVSDAVDLGLHRPDVFEEPDPVECAGSKYSIAVDLDTGGYAGGTRAELPRINQPY